MVVRLIGGDGRVCLFAQLALTGWNTGSRAKEHVSWVFVVGSACAKWMCSLLVLLCCVARLALERSAHAVA